MIRTTEDFSGLVWPACTKDVACIGDAWVATAAGEFDVDDLNLVRSQFPHRRVTLDGDVITVWPRPTTAR
ncbi:hypothetical protein ABZ864_43250 [Streptomyces sp. NPDC047082]|uniref:hypothetical protein n=1 Tax=Streptomyces sp. NPDC047082 TaxID=3155259 RepID=UPI0033D6FE78